MLSACLIVKNEESNLPRCLTSLRDVVDEIIVVDTGSTDNSKDVAASFGAQVYEFAWNNDFSAARNFSLAKARNRWALVIDADEELERNSAESLVHQLDQASCDAFTVYVYNYLGESKNPEVVVGSSVRIFRTDRGYAYRGRIHEDIVPSIVVKRGQIETSHVIIRHYGYLSQTAQGQSRFARNVRLLRDVLMADPGDGISWFYLGTEYFVVGEHEEAVKYYEQALQLIDPTVPIRPRLLRNLIESLRRTGRLRRAHELVLKAIGDYTDYPDLWFLRGLIEEELGDSAKALASYFQAATLEAPAIYETNTTATREKANLRAAYILFRQGRHSESLEHVMNVIAVNPRQVPAYTLAAQNYLALGHLGAAEELLQLATALDPSLQSELQPILEKITRTRTR